jgi:hypothetical protein
MSDVSIRSYRAEDAAACRRTWAEAGWTEAAKNSEAFVDFVESARSLVGTLHGEAECLVNIHPGSLRYLDQETSLACVTGVATSRVARRLGLAARVTAQALAEEALAGTSVAALGVFEQGFYNRLGFGNGPYETWCTFDPGQLAIASTPRPPARITASDWESVHESRAVRRPWHGAATNRAPRLTRAEMLFDEKAFGLGYFDATGQLAHHLWCSPEKPHHGPYSVEWMSYRTREEFVELLALLRGFGDQVHSVELHEPPGLQLQDLLIQPFKGRRITEDSPHVQRMTSSAYWQLRLLDLPGALSQTHLATGSARFQLTLTDPIAKYLPADAPWQGLAGDYVIQLGPESSAMRASDPHLPRVCASIGAFSRLWLGVRSATSLSWTDDLAAAPGVLKMLDRTLSLPTPSSDWDY